MPSPTRASADILSPREDSGSAIDCHALVFAADTIRYPFSPPALPLEPGEFDACFEAGELDDVLASGTLRRAVLVQRNRFYGFDNRLICDLAAADRRLRTLVSVDSRTLAGAAEAQRLLARPGVAGVRLMEPEKGGTLDWLAGEHARALWAVAADAAAIVDVHVFPWNRAEGLAALAGLMDAFPNVRVLLDNLGNGPVECDCGFDGAAGAVIDRPQLTLKFSEMTLARIERAGLDRADAIAKVAARTGADRLIWGSDILPPQVSVAQAAARAAAATATLSAQARQAVLSDNAAKLFGFAVP